jgi:uncharacterized Zn-finger protein
MKYIKNVMAALLIVALSSTGAMGKSSGFSSSSSGSSSSSSRSFSSSSSSKPSSFTSNSKSYTAPKATSSGSSSGSSKPYTASPQTSGRVTSNVDTARYKAASQSGTAFKTRESAVADFKAKKASSYTSRYNSEPASRPTHIPSTYREGGTNRTIIYNQSSGGYGFYNSLGAFMIYDAMSDSQNLNKLMSQNNYYVGQPPSTHFGALSIFFIILALVAGGAFVCWLLFK